MEDAYKYRNKDFEELNIKEIRDIHAATMHLVQKLTLITID